MFYTRNTVLNQTMDISNGIGYPSIPLTACLLGSWIIVFLIIVKGVKSSGKASYFLALFPYVILVALLIRAVTLDGSMKGIMYFLTPQWDKLLSPKVISKTILGLNENICSTSEATTSLHLYFVC